MKVIEFSECFPNGYEPFSGEFVYQHLVHFSKYASIKAIVPLRYVPPKELFSLNPFKSLSEISKWIKVLNRTKDIRQKNLEVINFRYFSLPRPYFDYQDLFLFRKLFFKRIKKLLGNKKIDLIYCHWFRPGLLLCKKLSEHYNVPLVLDHHEDIRSLNKAFPEKYYKMFKLFELADKIVVHSEQNRQVLIEEAAKRGLNLPEVLKIYLGQNFIVNNKDKEFSKDDLKLICVSHLTHARKRIEMLIKAVSLIKNNSYFKKKLSLKIVGDGVLRNQYEKLADELLLNNNVEFVGGKNHTEIEELLEESDLFILPSDYEPFGVVFIEALSKGVPVVTCKGNGGGEELANLGGGVELVAPNSESELSKKIIELGNDHEKLMTMSKVGKDIVRENFTWDKNALSTYKTFKEIIASYKPN
ncbi:MAG: glycosyltransferase family 4 protein [Ignavibacteria bacterium]|nr:glycosyltransferase family 4 protein [Ignavibacteria bacterium]